ncbi:MAG: hypothetical protein II992_12480 [Lachnospiraceae bacterium]|nr:hypothetical protein [Lachnospiraceae bacterium]
MNYYRDSSLKFFYFMIFPVFFVGFLLKANVEKQICFGLGICYLLLLISVALPIVKRRKEIKEIQRNGKCYVGNIENLIEVEVGTTYNRFGNTEYDNAYYLKVIPKEKISANHFVYSDILIGKKGQKISKEVLIYDWYGKTFVVCTDVKTKQHYKIEQTKEIIHYSWNRKCLIYVNRLIIVIDILLIIAWICVTFVEK